MKRVIFILFFYFNLLNAQQDYHALYNQISDSVQKIGISTDAHFKLLNQDTLSLKDSVGMKLIYKQQEKDFNQSVLPLYKALLHTTFPDISFTDQNFVSYNLSSFSNQHLILNYNYLYCQPCLVRIDSTLNLIRNKDIKLIVLLKDNYRHDVNDLMHYGDKILIGFMTPETVDLLSLHSGDDKMFLLNKLRSIEYFDGVESENRHETWLKFLKFFDENK